MADSPLQSAASYGPATSAAARIAGGLYVAIIVLGLSTELLVRGQLITPGDAAATAQAVAAAGSLFSIGILADAAMIACDVALAVLLYMLLRPAGPIIALLAMAFRLMQAAAIGASLMHQLWALLAFGDGEALQGLADPTRHALALHAMEAAAYGYDLGLLFFGVNSLLTGWLIIRSGLLPRLIGYGVLLAGLVYLAGGSLRIVAPDAYLIFQPAYLIPVVAEIAFALWLLIAGVRSIAR